MQHTVVLKMPSDKVSAGSVAALANATSKRKKQEFADMVVECQNVILAWVSEIEAYIGKGRDQPESPFQEIEYWRRRLSALTSIENQLKQVRPG